VVETDEGVKSVPEKEIVKGYEFAHGQHVLLRQEELDEYKLETKPSIELGRFVEAEAIDERYFEKPYYLSCLMARSPRRAMQSSKRP
jgi:DNA end-binding protein Ku